MTKSIVALLFCVIASGCTSDEGALKKQGLALAEQAFYDGLRKEATDANIQSSVMRDDYVSYMKLVSSVEVEEVTIHSPGLATVSTYVNSYPVNFRKTLVSIAGSIDPAKTRSFNFGDASNLVGQQKGLPREVVKQSMMAYKFKKVGDRWVLVE